MNPFSRFPFLRFVAPLILGISAEVYLSIAPLYCFSALILFTLVLLVFSYSKKIRGKYHYRYFFAVLLQLLWLSIGMALTSISDETYRPNYFGNTVGRKYLVVKLKEPLSRKLKSWRALGEVTGVFNGAETKASRGSLLLYFMIDGGNEPQLYCGDEILIASLEQDLPGPKNPGEFDFSRLLAYQNIHRQIFLKAGDWRLIKYGSSFELLRGVYRVRDMLLDILKHYIDDKTERGVAGALLFGYKDELDYEVVDAYARTGTLHVLAVSGMHVAILFLVVSFLFKPFRKNKAGEWSSAIITIFVIWFYSLLSGMSPSIVRASVMFTIIVLGKVLRDDISIYNNLFCSACMLLCYNPYFLFDAGFQLSYLAVLGIVYFQPKIAQVLVFKTWIGNQVWALVTVSVAAQIATFPISLFYFNQFPNYFILSNLIIIPITSLVMYAGIVLIVVCKITSIASIIGYAINKLIALADYLIFEIQSMPGAVTERLYINKTETLLLYVLMASVSVYFIHAQKKYLRFAVLIFLMLLLDTGIRRYHNATRHVAVLNAINGSFSLNIIEGKTNVLFCDSSASNSNIKLKSHFKGFWNYCGVHAAAIENEKREYESSQIKFTSNYLVTPSTNMCFIDEHTNLGRGVKISVVYLVLHGKCKISLDELIRHIKFDTLVLDGSMKAWRKNRYIEEAKERGLKYYDLLDEGAIVLEKQGP